MANPLSATSPAGLWIADNLSQVDTNLVGSWPSATSDGYAPFENTDADKPSMVVPALDDNKGLLFNGSSSRLYSNNEAVTPATPYLQNVSGITLYGVVRSNKATLSRGDIIGFTTEQQPSLLFNAFLNMNSNGFANVGARRVNADAFVSTPGTTTINDNIPRVLCGVVNFATGKAEIYVNGVLEATGTLSSIGNTVGPSARMAIGAGAGAVGNFWGGHIAMTAIYHAAHGISDRAEVHTWVQDTYGIKVADYAVKSSGPVSDVSVGQWKNNLGGTINLFQAVDEPVIDDLDFLTTPVTATASVIEQKFPHMIDPNSSTGHQLSYRIKVTNTSPHSVRVSLMEGTTERAFWVHDNLPLGFQDFTRVLTAVQADSIVNYSDLRIKISVSSA